MSVYVKRFIITFIGPSKRTAIARMGDGVTQYGTPYKGRRIVKEVVSNLSPFQFCVEARRSIMKGKNFTEHAVDCPQCAEINKCAEESTGL